MSLRPPFQPEDRDSDSTGPLPSHRHLATSLLLRNDLSVGLSFQCLTTINEEIPLLVHKLEDPRERSGRGKVLARHGRERQDGMRPGAPG